MTEENEENSTKEKLEGVGQEIIGKLEIIGGILTADPITQAEGEFNVEVGHLRHETGEETAEEPENTDQNE